MEPHVLRVSIVDQLIELRQSGELINSYPVSTSMFGTGSDEGSNKTPLGTFEISEKYGEGHPWNTTSSDRCTACHRRNVGPSEAYQSGSICRNDREPENVVFVHIAKRMQSPKLCARSTGTYHFFTL